MITIGSKDLSKPYITSIISILRFQASKMANYASIPRHTETTSMWQYGTGSTSNKIKFGVWNVNGIRSIIKKGELQSYLESSQSDILCINETKIDLEAYLKNKKKIVQQFEKDQINNQIRNISFQLKGSNQNKFGEYYSYWNFCKVSPGYSGVLILSKYMPIKALQDFPCSHHLSLQGRCLTLQFQKFYVLNCYKPNSGPLLERLKERTEIYDKHFQQYIQQLQKNKTVIICGDLNVAHKEIDLANPKQNQQTAGFTLQQRQSFDSLLSKNKLIDTYRYFNPTKIQYTWWSTRNRAREKNIGWRIDYILSSSQRILRKAEIRTDVMGSDHCPVECSVEF